MYLVDEHESWSTCLSQIACINHTFYVLPRTSYRYIQCGFIPSAVWRISNKCSNSSSCRKLALAREISYRHLGMSGCLYIWGIHTSTHPPYIQGTSGDAICLCQAFICLSVHPLFVSSWITVGLSYQLIDIIFGHKQSHVWQAWVPVYSGYWF